MLLQFPIGLLLFFAGTSHINYTRRATLDICLILFIMRLAEGTKFCRNNKIALCVPTFIGYFKNKLNENSRKQHIKSESQLLDR